MSTLWQSGPRLPSEGGRNIPIVIRRAVMARDEGICRYCGEAATDLDHVYPWSNGGSHHATNLVACCERCNSIAGLRTFPEFIRKKAYILERRLELAAGKG